MKSENMKIVVTGGCGFIGRKSIERLLVQIPETKIRVLDNETTCSRNDLRKVCDVNIINDTTSSWDHPVSMMVADVRDAAAVLACTDGADAIIHLAANTGVSPSIKDPVTDCLINVLGTLNVLEACRLHAVGQMIFASSGAPLGVQVPPLHEELAAHPASPYGASKLAGEGYCSAYFHAFGVKSTVLRFGNVYGPGSGHKSSVVAKFIQQALAGQDWEIYGDGAQTRDFIYIDDLISAIMASLMSPHSGGETFQIATSNETTIAEMTKMLRMVLQDAGIGVPNIHFSAPRVGDVNRNFSDTSKAKNLLNWEAKVNLCDGLKRTVQDFKI